MEQGGVFLTDEISLADDSVLERLNSVLEPERTLLIAEKGEEIPRLILADTNFHFIATMNPGGDYGKKEVNKYIVLIITQLMNWMFLQKFFIS
jgi:midasin